MYSTDSSDTPKKSSSKGIGALQPIYAFFKSHHKTAAIITLSVLATAVAVPYAAQASSDSSSSAQPATKPATTKATSEGQPMTEPNEHIQNDKTPQADNNSSQTSVTVNGQTIEVPANGSYSKTTTDENGQTHVNVESSNEQTSSGTNGSTSNQSSSSVNINVHSQSKMESSDE